MKSLLSICMATLALSSVAFAEGDDEKKKNKPKAKAAVGAERAESPASGWNPPTFKYDQGTGLSVSTDEISLNIRNIVQPLYRFAERDSDTEVNKFDFGLLRTVLSGEAMDGDLEFRLTNDWNETTSVKDAWIRYTLHSTDSYSLVLRGGQQKATFGREFNIDDDKLDFVDRSWGALTHSNARSRGLQVTGSLADNQLSYTLGAFNTDVAAGSRFANEDGMNNDNRLDYLISLDWASDPTNVGMRQGTGADLNTTAGVDFAVGLGGYRGAYDLSGFGLVRSNSAFAYAEVRSEGVAGLGEFFWRNDEGDLGMDSTSYALSFYATYTAPAQEGDSCRWGVGARWSYLEACDTPISLTGTPLLTSHGQAQRIEAAVNFFENDHAFKHQFGLAYEAIDQQAPGIDENFVLELLTTYSF